MIKNLLKKIFWSRSTVIAIPYIWLFIFFAIPFAIVFKISFAIQETAIPPFSHLFEYDSEGSIATIFLHFEHYLSLYKFSDLYDPLYGTAYLNSIRLASLSTVFCLLFGYPIAYAIARSSPSIRGVLLMAVILPSWTSFLIRIYAWLGILKNNGLFNNFLVWAHIIDENSRLTLLYTDFSVYIGIVYIYVPYMILPIYTNLIKLDNRYLEASADLGARPWKTFLTVTLPLSMGGIIAGCMLVFIPAVGEYIIPNILGGPDQLMIGKVLGDEFSSNHDWPRASAVAVTMLAFLLVPIVYFHKTQSKEIAEGKA